MDSKWKRTAVCVSACMCLLLLLLVLFTNLPKRKGTADAGCGYTVEPGYRCRAAGSG